VLPALPDEAPEEVEQDDEDAQGSERGRRAAAGDPPVRRRRSAGATAIGVHLRVVYRPRLWATPR